MGPGPGEVSFGFSVCMKETQHGVCETALQSQTSLGGQSSAKLEPLP